MQEPELAGTDRIRAAVAVFYEKAVADPEVARWFADVDLARLRAHMHAFLIVALGGPAVYDGRSLDEAHAGLQITDEVFDAVVEHLADAFREVGMSEAMISELRERVGESRPLIVRG